MPRPFSYGPRQQVNVRVSAEALDRIRAEADRRCVSLNYLMEMAVLAWLASNETAAS